MRALFVLILGLGVPGLLPALAVARRSAAVIFLAPIIGACMAAVGAELELGIGGSLLACYLVVAVAVNIGVVAWWLAAGRFRQSWAGLPLDWSIATVVVMLDALVIPLTALRAPLFGRDAEQIWLTHAMMIYGGHHQMLTSLTNPAYWSGNPDYPPLVPAAGALAFGFFGLGNLHIAIDMTVLLNACALGMLGTGIATVGSAGRPLTRMCAIVAGAAVCLAGFAVAGIFGVNGYADLLWAAVAAAAIVWGLVLPRSTQALSIAWICAAAASLTKNEGLTTAFIVLVLIAFRYRPPKLPWLQRLRAQPGSRRDAEVTLRQTVRSWAECAAFIVVPALPGLAWAGLARHIGLKNRFLSSSSTETMTLRADVTIHGIAGHLAVAPVAAAVLVAGCLFLRRDRQRAGLGNPAWLWLAWLGSLAIIFATYVIGPLEIYSWLANSVNRTTIFAQLLLYAELAIWLVIAVDAISPNSRSEQPRASAGVAETGEAGQPHLAGQHDQRSAAPEGDIISR
jgi:hypothetical protein